MQKLQKSKKIQLTEIPEEWEICNLGTISELFVPMRDKPKKFDGDIPWLRIDDLDGKFATDSKVNQRVSNETVKKMNLRIYPVGTVLCSCSATIGVCAITTRELITNQTFIGIYPKSQLDKQYLYYYLLTQENNLKRIGSGSTIPYISREKFEKFPIPLPGVEEQQKIISILSNLDELIQKIEQTIILQNKLYDYFIDSVINGNLTKNWRKSHNVPFFPKANTVKPSNVSEIPNTNEPKIKLPSTWKWNRLGDLLEYLTDYHSNGSYAILKKHVTLLDKPDYAYVIRATNFEKNDFTNSMKYITKEAYEFLSKSKLYGEEILIGKIGNAGSVYYMPILYHPCSLGMNLFALKISSIANSKYIYLHLLSSFSKKNMKQHIKGVGTPSIDKKSVRSLFIALPPLIEQKKIVEFLDSLHNLINKNLNLKKQTENLKKGLMQQLLTGKIRVKV